MYTNISAYIISNHCQTRHVGKKKNRTTNDPTPLSFLGFEWFFACSFGPHFDWFLLASCGCLFPCRVFFWWFCIVFEVFWGCLSMFEYVWRFVIVCLMLSAWFISHLPSHPTIGSSASQGSHRNAASWDSLAQLWPQFFRLMEAPYMIWFLLYSASRHCQYPML